MKTNMWDFNDKWSKVRDICMTCGMVLSQCMCHVEINLQAHSEFWLLVHANEFERTSNTGRLIEKSLESTKVFKWDRVCPPKELLDLLESDDYQIYLVMAGDKEEEKKRQVSYQPSHKKTVFLILDGTWKEVRKILRKSPYLDKLAILSIQPDAKTAYDLRRSSEDHHLCTVETAIALLDLTQDHTSARGLEAYYHTFLKAFEISKASQKKDA